MGEPEEKYVVVCRSAADSLHPGATLGFFCFACQVGLQATPDGARRILEGADAICNRCAGHLVREMKGKDMRVVRTSTSPVSEEKTQWFLAMAKLGLI